MICGIGVDIVEIDRIRNAAQKWGDKFLRRIFDDDEISYCRKNKNPFSSLAARFAAKEAFIKAISGGEVGWRTPKLSDIVILNHPSGKPYIDLRGDLTGRYIINVTLSHERHYAVATVIVETKEK
ncbi:MAG: holo-ACP synthase [Nitrospirae bacterium]|nr:holo-ACP synthase [Nitrospirota bacterium]